MNNRKNREGDFYATDIERMIMESHYLNALEIESSAQKPLAEMERADYLNQIKTLTDTVTQLRSLLQSVTEAFESVNKQSEKKDLQIEWQTLIMEDLKNEVRNLREQLAHMKKDRFGSSSLKTRKGTKPSNSRKSRDEEEQDYDGSKKEEAPSPENSSEGKAPSEDKIDKQKVKSENPNRNNGPSGSYTRMDAARVVHLSTKLDNAPKT